VPVCVRIDGERRASGARGRASSGPVGAASAEPPRRGAARLLLLSLLQQLLQAS